MYDIHMYNRTPLLWSLLPRYPIGIAVHGKEIRHYEKQKAEIEGKLPSPQDDEEAERFVATADLSEYDLSGMVSARFRVQAKD